MVHQVYLSTLLWGQVLRSCESDIFHALYLFLDVVAHILILSNEVANLLCSADVLVCHIPRFCEVIGVCDLILVL